MTETAPKKSCLKKKGNYNSHVSQLSSPASKKTEISYVTTISPRATKNLVKKILAPYRRVSSKQGKTYSQPKHRQSTVLFSTRTATGNETPPQRKSPPRITNGRRIPLVPGYSQPRLSPDRDLTHSTGISDLVKQTKKENTEKKHGFYAFAPKMAPMLNLCKKEETVEKSKSKCKRNSSSSISQEKNQPPARSSWCSSNIKSTKMDSFTNLSELIQQRYKQKPFAQNLSRKMKNFQSADNLRTNSRDLGDVAYVLPLKEKNHCCFSDKVKLPLPKNNERELSCSSKVESIDLNTSNQAPDSSSNLKTLLTQDLCNILLKKESTERIKTPNKSTLIIKEEQDQKSCLQNMYEKIKTPLHAVQLISDNNNYEGVSATEVTDSFFTEGTSDQEKISPLLKSLPCLKVEKEAGCRTNIEYMERNYFSDLKETIIHKEREQKSLEQSTACVNYLKCNTDGDTETASLRQESISTPLKCVALVKSKKEPLLNPIMESTVKENSSDQRVLTSQQAQKQISLPRNMRKKIETSHGADNLTINNDKVTEELEIPKHRLRNDYQSFILTQYSRQQFHYPNKQRVFLDSVKAYFKFRKMQKHLAARENAKSKRTGQFKLKDARMKPYFNGYKKPLILNPF